MTRDEAIATELVFIRRDGAILGLDGLGGVDRELAAVNVDRLVAFGLLKLDEPVSEMDRKISKACSMGHIKARDWDKVVRGLELAGLKIVEK